MWDIEGIYSTQRYKWGHQWPSVNMGTKGGGAECAERSAWPYHRKTRGLNLLDGTSTNVAVLGRIGKEGSITVNLVVQDIPRHSAQYMAWYAASKVNHFKVVYRMIQR